MKNKINVDQLSLDMFQGLDAWPNGYYNGIYKINNESNIYGFDTETEGLNAYKKTANLKSISLSPKAGVAYASSFPLTEQDSFKLKEIISNENNILVSHNIKYDVNWIALKLGIQVKCMLFDTMFAQYLIDENVEHNSLKEAVNKYLDKDYFGKYKDEVDFNRISRDDLLIYNCKDADASRRLYDVFVPKLKRLGLDKLMITSSMILPILAKMEQRGVYLDKEYAHKTQTKLFKELVSLRYSMSDIVHTSFNPDSSKDVGKLLYSTLHFNPIKTTDKGTPSTDAEGIAYLYDQCKDERQNQFLDSLLEYKKKIKLITTYYQPIERWTKYDGRVHTNYSLGRQRNEEGSGGTVTGRLSSNNPNLQNIPRGKEHRGMFCASNGFTLLDGDFSQLELRVAAFISQEDRMIDAFNKGYDIHTATMSGLTGLDYDYIEGVRDDPSHKDYEKIKNERVAYKSVNFGIFYGMSKNRLQRELRKVGIHKDLNECQEYIDNWFKQYPKCKEWLEQTKLFAVSRKYVSMPLNQRRRLPDAEFTYGGSHSLRQATNFPVQSLASWICLIGLKLLDDYFEEYKHYYDAHILMQVHDSITSEINIKESNLIDLEDIKVDVKKIMEVETLNYIREVFGVDFNVPLVFDLEYKTRWS